MKKYEYLYFDLDGTLTDSCEGIYKSFEYALGFYGIEVKDLNTLKPVLGPPLKDSFVNLYESFSRWNRNRTYPLPPLLPDHGQRRTYCGLGSSPTALPLRPAQLPGNA